MTRKMEELTGGDGNAASWVPADSYVNKILEASVCYGQLSGVITAVDYDMQACDGDQIQIRYIRARTAQGAMDEGALGCLSATSSTIGTQAVQIYKWGDYDKIPGFTEFEVCGNLRASIMNEMSKGLAKKRDQEVWDDIYACHPHHRQVTDNAWALSPQRSGSCCTYGYNLYDSIISAQKFLQGKALNPDYVILHPTVAKYLYFADADSAYPVIGSLVKFGEDTITKINGMKVIECCNAQTGVTTSGATLAVVLDSSIACAEAWGKRPTFSRDYVPDCDYTKEVLWMYWGSSAISGTTATGSVEGVAHIVNP